jgi:hypothetical protein
MTSKPFFDVFSLHIGHDSDQKSELKIALIIVKFGEYLQSSIDNIFALDHFWVHPHEKSLKHRD